MRRFILSLLSVAVLLSVALSGSTAQADEPDAPQVCDWSTTNYGTNNGFRFVNVDVRNAYADYRLQLRTAPGCTPQLRGALNFRCYYGEPSPANCHIWGTLFVFRYSSQWNAGTAINHDSGVDGIGTVYTGWYNVTDGSYLTKAYLTDTEWSGAPRPIADGYYGASHSCAYFSGGTSLVC